MTPPLETDVIFPTKDTGKVDPMPETTVEALMAEGQNTAAILQALSQVLSTVGVAPGAHAPVVTPAPVTPGFQTSEFWMTSIFSVLAMVLPAVLPAFGPWGQVAGLIAGAVATAYYSNSRGAVKAAATAPVIVAPTAVTPPVA